MDRIGPLQVCMVAADCDVPQPSLPETRRNPPAGALLMKAVVKKARALVMPGPWSLLLAQMSISEAS